MYIEALSNGLGGQSIYLLWLAGRRIIKATASITADTGAEEDCQLFDGTRISAGEFWRKYVYPLACKWGIDARFVRSVDENKEPLPSLWEDVVAAGSARAQDIPLYGSNGGRLRQSCTDKWKIRAIKQEARRMGATSLLSAQGIHFGEAARRVKGIYLRNNGKWSIYQTVEVRPDLEGNKAQVPVQWMQHYYPLVDLQMDREAVRVELARLKLPYLLTSECDHCPHKDAPRWLRTSPEVIERVAAQEASYEGKFFFTDRRIPLKLAVEQMRAEAAEKADLGDADFGCGNDFCGV
jgi:hypothetical protein